MQGNVMDFRLQDWRNQFEKKNLLYEYIEILWKYIK